MLKDNNKKRHIVIVGKGGGGGGTQVQSDWAQTDNTQPDYIKNKPEILDNTWFGTQAEFDALTSKDPDIIYYIEDTSAFPEYLTVTYVVPEPNDSFKILDNTDNIAGYRVKGATAWETPVTTIAVTTIGTIELEFNLTDNTKIARYQFQYTYLCKVDLPATITTLDMGCFYNCRCLTELPNLQNVTCIADGDVFGSTNITVNKYVINDNVTRNYAGFGSAKASGYIYVNGTLHVYLNGSMGDSVKATDFPMDLSNGIDGLPIYKINFHFRDKSFTTVKLPSTLTEMMKLAFMEDNITNVYMYATTPPTGGGFYECNITNFYVPQGSLAAYQAAYPSYASVMQEMS